MELTFFGYFGLLLYFPKKGCESHKNILISDVWVLTLLVIIKYDKQKKVK